MCYLNIVQMDIGPPLRMGRKTERNKKMTYSLNRLLDVTASVAIVVLSVITAGATVALGA